MTHLCYQETFDFLKKEVENGYFEQLIRDYLLDNPFEAVIVVAPEKNLTAKEDDKLAKKLAAYKASLSEEELEKLVTAGPEQLKEYQDDPVYRRRILAENPHAYSGRILKGKADDILLEVKKKRVASRCCTTTSLPPGSDI
ncbi:MAG: hypothetical protein ACLTF6_09645 [Clostridium sp.]